MYLKKDLLTIAYKSIENLKLTNEREELIPITSLLTPNLMYQICNTIVCDIPTSDMERVVEFNKAFKVSDTETVEETRELTIRLILEESIELGFSLGLDKRDIYSIFLELLTKVEKENLEAKQVNVFDALLDLIYVTYRGFYIHKLIPQQEKGMLEVHTSNMSKLLPIDTDIETIKKCVSDLKEKGFTPRTEDLHNGYIAIRDSQTNKILKPLTHKKANLTNILNN
jgi:predicted HAD superfamily Cof-like phosphohydrolase